MDVGNKEVLEQQELPRVGLLSFCSFIIFFFSSISLTVGAKRLMEAQMDLPRLLFGIGFQIFIVTLQIFTFSREYVENVRGYLLLQPQMHITL